MSIEEELAKGIDDMNKFIELDYECNKSFNVITFDIKEENML